MKRITTCYILTLISLGVLLFLGACEEATDWDYQPGENGKLVVEAIITNQVQQQEIKLSLSRDDINGNSEPVSEAIVIMDNGVNQVAFIETTDEPGKYLSEQAFATQFNRDYNLTIEYNNETYTATNRMAPVYPLPNFTFSPVQQGEALIINGPSLYSTVEQAMYEIDIDWSHLTNQMPNQARQFFYTFTTIDVNEIFKPGVLEPQFPPGSIVTVKKYSLNDEYAEYIRALVMETEWQGGIFDESSSSLPTNISNDGLGFFAICAVLCDEIIAQ